MSIKIKNYTSSVPVERTVMCIEKELVKIGVNSIEKAYKDGDIIGILFSINIPHIMRFKIPANVDAAYDIIKTISEYKSKNKDWLQAQAKRTAWRIVLNWVENQVAMVQLNQVDALQIFLPYMYDSKTETTFYDKLKNSDFKLLLE